MRRRKQSALDDLFKMSGEVFTLVHPIFCIPVAIIAWYLVASLDPPATELTQGSPKIFGMLGYLIAVIILLGGFKGWRQRRKREVFAKVNADMDWVRSLSWREFEEGVAEVYRNQGFTVELLGGNGPDGGIDLRMQMDGATYVVQCKHWKSSKVGVKPIRELFGVMTSESADYGIFIASGSYTREAESFASGKNLRLIGGEGFLELVHQLQGSAPTESTYQEDPVEEIDESIETTPVCPRCESGMKLRTSKKGPTAGQQFWGCSQFPKCKGTRELY